MQGDPRIVNLVAGSVTSSILMERVSMVKLPPVTAPSASASAPFFKTDGPVCEPVTFLPYPVDVALGYNDLQIVVLSLLLFLMMPNLLRDPGEIA